MTTIDQLDPATSASNSDEFIVSQSGTVRKITRAQVLNGVQPALTLSSGSLLGRSSTGWGAPQVLAVGANLTLNAGTLSASAAPFVIGSLPAGNVPAGGDQVAVYQSGTNVAVTYDQLLSGISGVPNVDLSQGMVTPTGKTGAERLADLAANVLTVAGATLTGVLALAGNPASPAQAANKAYVDLQVSAALPLTGGSMLGILTLATSPRNPLDSATKGYVDSTASTLLPLAGGSLYGSLLLSADPSVSQQAATKNYADLKLSRAGDTLTGVLALAADPTSPSQAATKNYVDTQTGAALPKSGGTLTGSLVLASDPTTNAQAATKQYVDQRVYRSGDTLTGALTLASDPVLSSQAATKNYVDTQIGTAVLRAGASMSGALLLGSDPSVALQASTKQYVDLHVLRNGDTLTGALYLASNPTSPLQAATKQYVDSQATTSISATGVSFTGTVLLAADPTVPLQAATKHYVDTKVATSLPLTGGSLAGTLSLAGVPTLPLQAATKSYVDANPNAQGVINVKLAPYGAKLDGVTDDTAAFKAAYVAAPAGSAIYVPNGTSVIQAPSTWGVALTKYVKWIVDGTVLSNGTPLAACIPNGGAPAAFALPGFVLGNTQTGLSSSQANSQATDFTVNQSCYIVSHAGGTNGQVATNTRSDTIIYNSPGNYIWNALDRLIWTGIQTPNAVYPAQHVGRYIQTLRQAATAGANGQYLPQPQLWAACLEYRDTTGLPSSSANNSLTIEMDWFGNGLDDANTRTIQSLVVGQHNTSGPAVEVSSVIGVWLAAGSTGSVKSVFSINIPFSHAVLDTTPARSINNAPAIMLAAGQAIAFDSTNNNRLAYNSTTGVLTWSEGSQSYPVGKGISVGWQNSYSTSTTLANTTAGNIIFLTGTSAYTITLPAASTVAAGTGYTFSVLGSAPVGITPNGTDSIDCGPVTLRTYDRYHLVSDGSSTWREVFRTNAVAPRFSGTPVLPSFTVSNLPTGMAAGALAFASNGRKPSEAAGAGSGITVFFDGNNWISQCSGLAAVA